MVRSHDSHVSETPAVRFWDAARPIVRFGPSVASSKRGPSILYIRSPNLLCCYCQSSSTADPANKPKAIHRTGSSYIFMKHCPSGLIHQLNEKAWGRTMLTFISAQLI